MGLVCSWNFQLALQDYSNNRTDTQVHKMEMHTSYNWQPDNQQESVQKEYNWRDEAEHSPQPYLW